MRKKMESQETNAPPIPHNGAVLLTPSNSRCANAELLESQFAEESSDNFDIELVKRFIDERGKKIKVNGVELYYKTVGSGPHVLLLHTGFPGTIASDYMPQMLPGGFDRENYTLVSFEPRGFGQSVPPKRTSFLHGYQEQDAKDAVMLMEELGHKQFSWVGWCSGGNVGIVAAALYPDRIRSLITWGSYPIITKNTYEAILAIRSIDNWSDQAAEIKYLEFDRDYLRELFIALCTYNAWVYEKNNGDCVKSYLPRIRCPTLVMWPTMDYFIGKEQVDIMLDTIRNVKMQIIEGGKHAFHLKSPAKFRAIVEEFLSTVPATVSGSKL